MLTHLRPHQWRLTLRGYSAKQSRLCRTSIFLSTEPVLCRSYARLPPSHLRRAEFPIGLLLPRRYAGCVGLELLPGRHYKQLQTEDTQLSAPSASAPCWGHRMFACPSLHPSIVLGQTSLCCVPRLGAQVTRLVCPSDGTVVALHLLTTSSSCGLSRTACIRLRYVSLEQPRLLCVLESWPAKCRHFRGRMPTIVDG